MTTTNTTKKLPRDNVILTVVHANGTADWTVHSGGTISGPHLLEPGDHDTAYAAAQNYVMYAHPGVEFVHVKTTTDFARQVRQGTD